MFGAWRQRVNPGFNETRDGDDCPDAWIDGYNSAYYPRYGTYRRVWYRKCFPWINVDDIPDEGVFSSTGKRFWQYLSKPHQEYDFGPQPPPDPIYVEDGRPDALNLGVRSSRARYYSDGKHRGYGYMAKKRGSDNYNWPGKSTMKSECIKEMCSEAKCTMVKTKKRWIIKISSSESS